MEVQPIENVQLLGSCRGWDVNRIKKIIIIKITAFDLHISPLCRAGPAWPIFTIFGMLGHMADITTHVKC